MSEYLKIAGVSERDTDLLLLEEFVSSAEFTNFILKLIGMDGKNFLFSKASRSVTDSTGESDLEVLLKDDNGHYFALLIENKVNAGFQPQQAERYRIRGTTYLTHGRVDGFATILLAPHHYFDGETRGFDFRINYESLREWFELSTLEQGRKCYKVSVLSSAIEKSTSGYQMIADAPVSNLWRDYWLLTLDVAPEFCMDEPTNKPASSSFIYFRNAGLPRGVHLVHKFAYGHFDLQFAGMGDKIAQMKHKYETKLSSEMQIVRANKSASIRVHVPKIFVADTIEQQRDAVISAIQAGKRLLAWGKQHV